MFDIMKIQTAFVLASGLITDKPCWLFSVICTESSTTPKSLYLRDGLVDGTPIILMLPAVVYGNGVAIFNYPVRFKNGLYLVFDSGLETAFVQFLPDY